jgi:8-oxo-dGTP diphosphatase
MSSKKYCYDYPRPSVSVDILIIADKKILLIERKNDPFKGVWALPGGFVEENEDLFDAACRELKEETGIENVTLKQFGAFGKPGRDPRGHTISIGFMAILPTVVKATAGDDANKAKWFSVDNLPMLAFDHTEIIQERLLCDLSAI